MSNSAAHLVDRVFPDVPVRQWVLSTPFELRFLLARRVDAFNRLLRGSDGSEAQRDKSTCPACTSMLRSAGEPMRVMPPSECVEPL